jgi:hypothetical protein
LPLEELLSAEPLVWLPGIWDSSLPVEKKHVRTEDKYLRTQRLFPASQSRLFISTTVQAISSLVPTFFSVRFCPTCTGSLSRNRAPCALTTIVEGRSENIPLPGRLPVTCKGTASNMRWLRRCLIDVTARLLGAFAIGSPPDICLHEESHFKL